MQRSLLRGLRAVRGLPKLHFAAQARTARSFATSDPSSALPTPIIIDPEELGNGELARDFIHDALYSPKFGYFNIQNRIFSGPPADFHAMKTRQDYLKYLHSLYQAEEATWQTPVEVFKPWYGRAILNWILETRLARGHKLGRIVPSPASTSFSSASASASTSPSASLSSSPSSSALPPLVIYEMGAGVGTCALNILDTLQQEYPDLYAVTEYVIVELSAQMHARQQVTLKHHQQRVTLHNQSIATWSKPDEREVFILGMEVIDNMPHDKILDFVPGKEPKQVHVHRVPVVTHSSYGFFEERAAPIQDPWIASYLNLLSTLPKEPLKFTHQSSFEWAHEAFMSISNFVHKLPPLLSAGDISQELFIPTVQYQLLHSLRAYLPNHHLILGDFNYLPQTISGINAPVVSSGSTTRSPFALTSDRGSYLMHPGNCDIFFPTDFKALHHVYHHTCGLAARQSGRFEKGMEPVVEGPDETSLSTPNTNRVYRNVDFMRRYGEYEQGYLQDGYNPMLQDFFNTCFFMGSSLPDFVPPESPLGSEKQGGGFFRKKTPPRFNAHKAQLQLEGQD